MSTEKRGGILVNWGSLKWKKYGYLHKIKLDFKMRVEKIQKKLFQWYHHFYEESLLIIDKLAHSKNHKGEMMKFLNIFKTSYII